jgi:hypothetical protein
VFRLGEGNMPGGAAGGDDLEQRMQKNKEGIVESFY